VSYHSIRIRPSADGSTLFIERVHTGNIGSGVLDACLRDPSVTSIVALSRRPLEGDNSKLKTIIVSDFSSYSDSVLDEAITCDGAIWCLGIMARRGVSADEKFKVTKGSITAFLEQLVPKLRTAKANGLRKGTKPFRLVWLGGMLAERDQKKDLWIISDIRKGLVSSGHRTWLVCFAFGMCEAVPR
jgi:hypothetical protein